MRIELGCISAVVALCCPFLLIGADENKPKDYQSLEKASGSGAIKLKIKGNGFGYSGECIDMTITNSTSDSGYYLLEAGRRLHSEDSITQDILVVKEQKLEMAPRQTFHIKVFGFCCQLHNHAPQAKSKYRIGKMGDKGLVVLAEFLNKNIYSICAMQQAVWCISDNNPVASISDPDMKSILPLREKVAEIKGVPLPWYTIKYENGTTELFSGKQSKVCGQIDYYIANNSEVEVDVFDEHGTMVQPLTTGLLDPDKYSCPFELDVKGWHKGKYYVRVLVDGRKSTEKEFEL
ncbi:MAG: hypothetical protein ACLQQ4_11065 [Bacteroidia bacterium]